jgi:flagellar biogenesis protein FliO
MPPVRPDQIVVLAVFLLLLGLAWALALRHRGTLRERLGGSRRLRVVEVCPIGPSDRALLISADGREFLVLRIRAAAPVIVPLGTAPPASAASPTGGA